MEDPKNNSDVLTKDNSWNGITGVKSNGIAEHLESSSDALATIDKSDDIVGDLVSNLIQMYQFRDGS